MNCAKPIYLDEQQTHVDCGKCMNCRIRRARDWTNRMIIESSEYPEGETAFVTLTYNERHIPQNLGLDHSHVQKFMKALRKKYPGKLRLFACGEYGEKLPDCPEPINPVTEEPRPGRPHYHLIIFGLKVPDYVAPEIGGPTKEAHKTQRSEWLEKIWGKGNVHVAPANHATMAYTCRYVTKKIGGEKAEEHYKTQDKEGNIYQVKPEYCQSSRRPGIGMTYFEKYPEAVAKGFITVDKKIMPIPRAALRYLDKQHDFINYKELAESKRSRSGIELQIHEATKALRKAEGEEKQELQNELERLVTIQRYRTQQKENTRRTSVARTRTL